MWGNILRLDCGYEYMKYGISIPNVGKLNPKLVVEYATTAEEAGWDGVFVSDCFSEGGYSDPFVILGGIATQTKQSN